MRDRTARPARAGLALVVALVVTLVLTGCNLPPDWLGQRRLPLGPDGLGEAGPTPVELIVRRFPTPTGPLPAPSSDRFAWSIGEVPPEVLARSTWHEGCPVDADELAYVVASHRGFHGGHHLGELIVHESVALDVVAVLRRLHSASFPIEELRVISRTEVDAHPTGDTNVSSAFVCRSTVGGSRWSEHAYGLALDLNPFLNPYVRGEVVIPELAAVNVDRRRGVPGVIHDGDEVVAAFADVGWAWGGHWASAKDWMHFSATGR